MAIHRRGVLLAGPTILAAHAFAAPSTQPDKGYAGFPSQDPALVREIVGKSHADIDAVRRLLERQPGLAKAAIDWGFGDWESALGAASHMGRVDIAELLLEQGARPDIFTHAMLGNLGAVRALIDADPAMQRLRGPHSFSLLHHARQGKERARAVAEYLTSLGGADEPLESLPMTDEAKQHYLGAYDAKGQRMEVVLSRGQLQIRKPGQFGRSLFAVGEHTFRPSGAEQVRIIFSMDGQTPVSFAVHAPEPIASARFIERI